MHVKVENASESKHPEVAKIVLAAVLDLRAAKALKGSLTTELAGTSAIAIDAGAVRRLSTAAIQVLVAFLAAMGRAKRSVAIVRPSAAFLAGFETLGLSPLIQPAVVEA